MQCSIVILQMGMLETSLGLFFSFLFCNFFRTTFLLKAPDTLRPFGTAIYRIGPEFLKKIAYNTLLASSVHLAIRGLLGMFQSQYPVLNFPLGLLKIDLCLINGYKTIKHLFWYFFSTCFDICTIVRFCSPVSKWGIQRALIFVYLRIFFKRKWTDVNKFFFSFISTVWQRNARVSE